MILKASFGKPQRRLLVVVSLQELPRTVDAGSLVWPRVSGRSKRQAPGSSTLAAVVSITSSIPRQPLCTVTSKMLFDRIAILFALTHSAYTSQPSAPSPISAPLRELPWAKSGLNFLHTTDTHGWHGGHLQEAQYSADWGDYISFAYHLRKRADEDGSDLLLIDTGDRVEGNGLYDASDPRGKYTFDIFKEQQMDVVTSGNHELYINTTSRREYEEMVPDYRDSYIASNLDIRDLKDGKPVEFAPRYKKFTTKNQGIRILAFGFLFDFKGNANNTVVQRVEHTVNEQWFKDAIREKDVDLFLVAGHVPVRNGKEFDIVYKAIRDVKWDTPIVFFGGHTHIRDYRKWEKKAYGIESGRYMETLGFLSISGLSSSKPKTVSGDGVAVQASTPMYERLYIDNNLFSLHHHSRTNASTFDTGLGRKVSQMIHDARKELKLDKTFGCAPHDFWLNRAPYPANDSILTLLEERVLPDTFTISNSSKNPSIVITNSGALRFDIFEGPFTTDTTYLVCPFTSGFRMIRNVPSQAASQVLQILNNQGPIPLKDLLSFVEGEPGWSEHKLDELLPPFPPGNANTLASRGPGVAVGGLSPHQIPLRTSANDEHQIPGYTTTDDAGNDGDDTLHQRIQFYNVPNCIGTNIGFNDDEKPDTLDLVYNEFIQDWVLLALRYLGVRYGLENTRTALEGKTMTSVISEWVGKHWECKD